MTKIKILIITAFITLISACATKPAKIDFDKNTEIDTSHYKTFAWLLPSKILVIAADANHVLKLRVDKSIEDAFIAKGYKLVSDPEKADFAISYTIGSREKIKVDSYPSHYNASFGWGRGYHGGRGGYYGGGGRSDTTVRQYTKGKLAIDAYDTKKHQPVWHGWATKNITDDEKAAPMELINPLVIGVVANFN